MAEWLPGAHPDHYMSGFTTFVPPDNAGFLAVGSRPVEAGTTVDTWQRRLEGAKELAYRYCDPAQQVQPITLGSERRTTVVRLHRGRGSHCWRHAADCARHPRMGGDLCHTNDRPVHCAEDLPDTPAGFHFQP